MSPKEIRHLENCHVGEIEAVEGEDRQIDKEQERLKRQEEKSKDAGALGNGLVA